MFVPLASPIVSVFAGVSDFVAVDGNEAEGVSGKGPISGMLPFWRLRVFDGAAEVAVGVFPDEKPSIVVVEKTVLRGEADGETVMMVVEFTVD